MSARNKRGECPYCGRYAKLTKDHVPPRALFRPRPQEQLITVLCCPACNRAASLDDEYFRLNLALRDDVGQEPDIVEIIPAVLRSLERPEAPGLRAAFVRGLHDANVSTPAGLFLGSRLAYNVDLDRLGRVPSRIVKAMFCRHRGVRLPDAYEVHSYPAAGFRGLGQEFAEGAYHFFAPLINTQPVSVGRVYSHWVAFEANDPNISAWLMVFYRRVVFMSFTIPRGAPPAEQSVRPVT